MQPIQTKKCLYCGNNKPISQFSIYRRLNIINYACIRCVENRKNVLHRIIDHKNVFSQLYITDIIFRQLSNLMASLSFCAVNISKAQSAFVIWLRNKNARQSSDIIIYEYMADAYRNYKLFVDFNKSVSNTGIIDTRTRLIHYPEVDPLGLFGEKNNMAIPQSSNDLDSLIYSLTESDSSTEDDS